MAAAKLLLLGFLVAFTASAAALDIYVYGDSLSDQGNTLKLTGQVPRPDVYWKGRYSNHFSWTDYVTELSKSSITIHNNAYGGAPACVLEGLSARQASIPPVIKQVEAYVKSTNKLASNIKRVHVIWGGHNDILASVNLKGSKNKLEDIAKAPFNALKCLRQSAEALLDSGEDIVVIATMFPARNKVANKAMKVLNKLVAAEYLALKVRYLLKAKVLLWDANKAAATVIKNYKKYGFSDVNSQCITYGTGGTSLAGSTPASKCTNPDKFVFFDSVHPSDKVYRELAKSFGALLAEEGLIPAAF